MAVQDDINAALAGDAAALKAVGERVAAVEQGLRDEITQLQTTNPSIDVAALESHLADLKTMADAIDAAPAATPVPDGGAVPAAPATPPSA